jgi:UDP-N-acetylglucosamine 4-epimerase
MLSLEKKHTWLLTGGAGFIGSHVLGELLRQGQEVRVLDNLSTGSQANLDAVRDEVGEQAWTACHFTRADITDPQACLQLAAGVDYVIHLAALGSVPWSIEDPLRTHASNVTGFLNVMLAARAQQVRRVVYASSSAVYGNIGAVPNREAQIGEQLSPYAASKLADEAYAESFKAVYGVCSVGLRFFNVFGPRQDPNGPYAAVIPRWIAALAEGLPCRIFGDGENTRDFCYVENVVDALLRASLISEQRLSRSAFNVAGGRATSLKELFALLRDAVSQWRPSVRTLEPIFEPFREGDVRHSMADLQEALKCLDFKAEISLAEGLKRTVDGELRRRQGASS